MDKEYIVMPCLVLDLDGTVRRSKSKRKFIKDEHDIEIMPGMYEAIKKYKENGYFIAGATNQGGIGAGLKSVEIVKRELKITDQLLNQIFDVISFCPSLVGGKVYEYSFRSLCRKPSYGMLALIEKYANDKKVIIDWDKSLMVGDRQEDSDMAKNAGISFYWIHHFLEMMDILKKTDANI